MTAGPLIPINKLILKLPPEILILWTCKNMVLVQTYLDNQVKVLSITGIFSILLLVIVGIIIGLGGLVENSLLGKSLK